ncbi:MAG: thermonuclease family protein [Pseudomonadota bacterium]
MSSRRIIHVLRDGLITLALLGGMGWAVLELDKRNATVLTGPFVAIDGDSLRQGERRLRLVGIDAPEARQMCRRGGQDWACGQAATRALRGFVRQRGAGRMVCKTAGLDKYRRWLVRCEANGFDVNAEMVRQGWAVDYGGYGREEGEARRLKVGLWTGQFETPQEWRRAQRGDVGLEPGGVSWLDRIRGVWARVSG